MASFVAPEAYPSFSTFTIGPSDKTSLQQDSGEDVDFLPAPCGWFDDSDGPSNINPRESDATIGSQMQTTFQASKPRTLKNLKQMEQNLTGDSILHCEARTRDEDRRECISAPLPAPSWTQISKEVLPRAARELLVSSMNHVYHTAQLSYRKGRWKRQYSDLGNTATGYLHDFGSMNPEDKLTNLPSFSSLSWVERQLVNEWRTYSPKDEEGSGSVKTIGCSSCSDDFESEEVDFQKARKLVPTPARRPKWQLADNCCVCSKTFGPTRLRHHCRLCGKSFCQAHSSFSHKLPHLGYHPEVPERVCDSCKVQLLERNLSERVAWRLARCRDHGAGELTPYFEIGVDSLEQVAARIADAALKMAKNIPLGAQAAVAVETVDVLRKYGLNGIYTIMLRQEFLAAADLLQKALGINRTAWPLSVHELSAAIFYALAQHRAMRGLFPDQEHNVHAIKQLTDTETGDGTENNSTSSWFLEADRGQDENVSEPVCDYMPDSALESLIFYAPIALNFVYAEREVEMQLLAAQQGWRLVYAHLDLEGLELGHDLPASALFVHDRHKIACLAIRGTSTIQDVVTDIRQVPLPFPESSADPLSNLASPRTGTRTDEDGWTEVGNCQGLAVCGMANAAINLYREHMDSVLHFAKLGYRVRFTGHSLGGGVATMLAVLARRDILQAVANLRQSDAAQSLSPDNVLRVYAYGTPPCMDATLAHFVEPFVTTAVLHDDAVPRLTPGSCRELLKFLLHIRETWVKEHLPSDILAITDRARSAWAPRWREGFTLTSSSTSIKRYCKNQILAGKKTLLSVKDMLVGEDRGSSAQDSFKTSGSDHLYKETRASDSHASQHSEVCTFVVDYMGGVDPRSVGILIDGDEFHDPIDALLERENDEFDDAIQHDGFCTETKEARKLDNVTEDVVGVTDGSEVVVLEESPLPRMFVPGKISHIYSHRGVYKAAFVPRAFRELRRLSLAGNMLADHKCKAYYEALLEVRTVRQASEAPPRWTAFDEDDTCSCCASKFTWASTFDNEAQEARDKHNCRSCGTLVCDPCSTNRVPLPSIGLTVPVRVCDRCYNDTDTFLGGNLFTHSIMQGQKELGPLRQSHMPERQRERRSEVVDDLAERVRSSKGRNRVA